MANRYSKALKHLKNKNIDEKLKLLEQIPTNNTAGIFVDTPGTFEPEKIEPGDLPFNDGLNLVEDGQGQEGYTGNDTTGLFLADGTIKSVEPPGDTSYILGPMMSMWYAWANYTQIGYVRQSDRKMVNLGRITGEMSAWDGETGFTGYGQLSIEQAVWFKGQTRADYRAFYPGPPSNPADEFGRYIGSLISSSKSTQTIIPGIDIPGINKAFDPNDVLSLLINKFGEGFNFLKDLIGDLGNEAAKLFNGLKDGLDVLNDVKSILDKAEQTNSILPIGHELGDPNFPDRPTLVPGSKGSKENPFERTLSDTTNLTLMNGISKDMSPSELRAQVQKNINTDFNFGAKGTLNNLTSDPYFDKSGNLVIPDTYAFSPGGDIADKPFLFGGTTGDFAKNFSNDPERQKDVLTTFDKSVGNLMPNTPDRNDPVVHMKIVIPPPDPKVQAAMDFQKTMSMDNFNKLSKSDQNKVMDNITKQRAKKYDGSNYENPDKYTKNLLKSRAKAAGKTKFKDGYMIDKDPMTGKERRTPIFSTIPGQSSMMVLSHQPSGKLLTENRKRILREIKKPVQVKEIPTKFKVKPTGRKNKSVGVDMMKIPDVPKQYKPQTNIWGKADYAANVRASQEKKNEVLELVGAAEHHWTYLTEDRRKKHQEKVNEMMSVEYDKQMELLYEKHRIKENKLNKAISAFKKPTDIAPEYPKEPPPQLDPQTGMHPKFGKNYKHDKLDPQSAESMPTTGNPEIDANVKKATNAKEKSRKLKVLLGNRKKISESMTTAALMSTTLPAEGDADLVNVDVSNADTWLSSSGGTTVSDSGLSFDQRPSNIYSTTWSLYNLTTEFDATLVNNLKVTVTTGTGVDTPFAANPLKIEWITDTEFGTLGTFSAGGGTEVFTLPKEANVKNLSLFYSVSGNGTNYRTYTDGYLVGQDVFGGAMDFDMSQQSMSILDSGATPNPFPPNYPTSEDVKALYGFSFWIDALTESRITALRNGSISGPMPPSWGGVVPPGQVSGGFTRQDQIDVYNQIHNLYSSYNTRASNLYTITTTNFQRRTPMNVFVSLDSPEATAFIRTDPTMQGLSAEDRRKKLIDMLDAGDEYLLKYLGLTGSSARPSDTTMPNSWEQASETQSPPKNNIERIADENGLPRDYQDRLTAATAWRQDNLAFAPRNTGGGGIAPGGRSTGRDFRNKSLKLQGFTDDQIKTLDIMKSKEPMREYPSPTYNPEPEPKSSNNSPALTNNNRNGYRNRPTDRDQSSPEIASKSKNTMKSNSFMNIRLADKSNTSNTSTSSGVKDYGNVAAAGVPRNTGGSSSGDPNNIQWPRDKYPNKKAPPGPGARTADVSGTTDYGNVAATYGGKEAENKQKIKDMLNDPKDPFYQAPRPSGPGRGSMRGDRWSAKTKQKTVVAHHEPEGKVLSEKKSFKDLTKKIPGYYDGKPAPLGFPMEEPPKTINGYHPDLVTSKGQKKQSNRYNRLDPQSAKAMPPTGNPHIDKKVRAAAKKPK